MQQLLGAVTRGNHLFQASQRLAEQFAIRIGELRRLLTVRNELLGLIDTIGEVWRRNNQLAHARMEAYQRVSVVDGWNLRRDGLVIRPQREGELVPFVDARLDPRFESSDRASHCRQMTGKINLELGAMGCRPHVRDNVTRKQTQRELVRVVEND